jgi:hypothetical protein
MKKDDGHDFHDGSKPSAANAREVESDDVVAADTLESADMLSRQYGSEGQSSPAALPCTQSTVVGVATAASVVEKDDENLSVAIGRSSTNNLSTGPLVKSRISRNASAEIQPGAVAIAGIDSERSITAESINHALLHTPTQHLRETAEVTLSEIFGALESAASAPESHPSTVSTEDAASERPRSVLVQAELVPPVIQAISVTIDEEQTHHHEFAEQYQQYNCNNRSETDAWCGQCPQNRSFWIAVIIGVFVALAIVIPATVILNPNSSAVDEVPAQTSTEATFDYPCYTSTYDLLWAQVRDLEASNFTKTKDQYIVCPGSYIKIGTFRNPAKNDYEIIDGDHPLTAITNDTVIQCGLDGSRDNLCFLDGGFSQVMMQRVVPGIEPHNPKAKEIFFTQRLTVHNVTFRGFTFTGKTSTIGSLRGVSFLLSQSGNVTVEDCLWTDLTPASQIIAVGQNVYQASEAGGFEEVPIHSAELTIRNCHFDNIVYDAPLILSDEQIVHVENCTFANLTVSALPEYQCMNGQGCASLLACMYDSKCSISNSCVFNVETLGPGLTYFDLLQSVIAPAIAGNESEDAAASASDMVKARLSSYNNYVDDASVVSCEVIIVDSQNSSITDCFDGLAFGAGQCSLWL